LRFCVSIVRYLVTCGVEERCDNFVGIEAKRLADSAVWNSALPSEAANL
jgi:hypothetical protein